MLLCTADRQVTNGCACPNNRNKRNPTVSAPLLYLRFKCPDVDSCRERGERKCPTAAAAATLRPPVGGTGTIWPLLRFSIKNYIKVYHNHWDMTGAQRSMAQNSARESCHGKKVSITWENTLWRKLACILPIIHKIRLKELNTNQV